MGLARSFARLPLVKWVAALQVACLLGWWWSPRAKEGHVPWWCLWLPTLCPLAVLAAWVLAVEVAVRVVDVKIRWEMRRARRGGFVDPRDWWIPAARAAA